jgi:hypothetical protein
MGVLPPNLDESHKTRSHTIPNKICGRISGALKLREGTESVLHSFSFRSISINARALPTEECPDLESATMSCTEEIRSFSEKIDCSLTASAAILESLSGE